MNSADIWAALLKTWPMIHTSLSSTSTKLGKLSGILSYRAFCTTILTAVSDSREPFLFRFYSSAIFKQFHSFFFFFLITVLHLIALIHSQESIAFHFEVQQRLATTLWSINFHKKWGGHQGKHLRDSDDLHTNEVTRALHYFSISVEAELTHQEEIHRLSSDVHSAPQMWKL